MPPPRSLPLVASVIVVAIIAIYARHVAGGKTWADVRYHAEVAPPRLAAAEAVQGGELPAWWDGSGLGVPLAAEPSHGAMYPPGWLAATPRALDLLAIAHLIWAALGVAIWARRSTASGASGASEPAALAVGLLVAASGLFASAAIRGALPALAHLPWIGAAASALAGAADRRERARAAAALGALLGLVGTAGVLAVLIDAIVLAVALAARRRTVLALAAAIAGGLAIGAAQWLPAIAQLPAGAGAEVHGLPLSRLVELIVPGAFGAGDPERGIAALAGTAPWAPSLFVGAPLLALAAVRTPSRRLLGALGAFAVAALVAGRGGWPLWLGAPELHAAALVAVLAPHAAAGLDALAAAERRALIALGVGTACAGAALGALVALRAQHPEAAAAIDRALLDGGIGLASMAAAVALAWRGGRAAVRGEAAEERARTPRAATPRSSRMTGESAKRSMPMLLVLLVLPSAGAAPSLAPVVDRALVEEPPPWAEAAQAARAKLEAPAPVPLRAFRPAFMHDRPEPAADEIATFAGASAWRWGIGAARSEDPARAREHDATWLAAARDGGALLDRFGISLAILPETLVMPRYLTALSIRSGWALVAFPAAPVASVLRGAQWAVAPDDAFALLFPFNEKLPRGTVVLRGGGATQPDRGPPLPCEVRRWGAGAIELGCTSDADGYAVISSASAPGWTATVDGAPVPWLTADVLRRAVPVAAGSHVIRWTYATPLGTAGLLVALAGALGLAALAGSTLRRRQ